MDAENCSINLSVDCLNLPLQGFFIKLKLLQGNSLESTRNRGYVAEAVWETAKLLSHLSLDTIFTLVPSGKTFPRKCRYHS